MLQVQTKKFGQGDWEVYYEGRILPKYVKADIAQIRRERDAYSDVRVLMYADPEWITPAIQAARSARRYAELEARALGWTEPSVVAEGAAAYAEALAGQA
jgi:hypothetical protein